MSIDKVKKIISQFSHKPILIGGRAIQYYFKKRESEDWDFVIHNSDVNIIKPLSKEKVVGGYKVFKNSVEMDFMNKLYGYTYNDIVKTATEYDDYYVASREMLIVLKALLVADPDSGPNHTVRKSIDDIYILGKDSEPWKVGY